MYVKSLSDNSEGVYYLENLQVESLHLCKPKNSVANTFPDFPNTISFFMFLHFGAVIFKVRQLLLSGCFLCYKVFTINRNVLYYESHFVCQFISKTFYDDDDYDDDDEELVLWYGWPTKDV